MKANNGSKKVIYIIVAKNDFAFEILISDSLKKMFKHYNDQSNNISYFVKLEKHIVIKIN